MRKMNKFAVKCNGREDCTDASDKIGCECGKDEFTCDCVSRKTCSSVGGCPKRNERCPDEKILLRDFGKINIHRLNDASECNEIGFPQCDNSTCYKSNFSTCVNGKCFTTHVICTSQCDDNELCEEVF